MTDLAPHQSGGRSFYFGGLAENADRSGDFQKARRHTRHVRLLRLTFPAVTVVMVCLYVASIVSTTGIGEGLSKIALPKILPTDLAMHNPNYEGYSEDGSMYKVAAETAKPNLKNTNVIKLHGITAELIDPQKQKTNMTAARGTFNSKSSILVLEDDIRISGDNGLEAKLKRAVVDSKKSLITSKKEVFVSFPAGHVRSKSLTIHQKKRHITFATDVRAELKPPEESAPKEGANSSNKLFVGSKKPILISSRTLEIFDADKRAAFDGDVVARQGTATLTTPKLEASYDPGVKKNKDTTGSQQAADSGLTSAFTGGGKLRRIVAAGPVVMTQGPADRVTCDAADFDALNETAILSGNVVMSSGPGRGARSDRADLDQGRDRAVLTGNVVVTQDKNVLRGRRLEVDQRAGTTLLTSPGGVGIGAGRISARFVQSAGSQRAASSQDNTAQSAGTLGQAAAFRADPNAPLDIIADRLLVQDRVKTATFSGEVQAKQGNFKIAARELHANYTGSATLGDVGSGSTSQASNSATELKSVKATKNVVITGNGNQKVKGDWADFDVATGKAVVGGNVEIQQGGNVVQGTRLTIDTTTGRSVIETAPGNTVAAPQGGGWVTTEDSTRRRAGDNKGRPSAVFYLDDRATNRPAAARPRPPSAGSAWQPQTAP